MTTHTLLLPLPCYVQVHVATYDRTYKDDQFVDEQIKMSSLELCPSTVLYQLGIMSSIHYQTIDPLGITKPASLCSRVQWGSVDHTKFNMPL